MTAAPPNPLRLFVRAYLVVASITAADGLIALLFAPYLATLGIPIDVIGLLLAAHGLAALASRLPAGMLYRGDRARWLLVGALTVATSVALLLPRVETPAAFAVLRLLGGLAFGVATTTNMARFIEAVPPGVDRARAMGYFSASLALGLTVGNGLAGFIGQYLGYAFAFQAAAGLYAAAGLLAVTLPSPRATAPASAARARPSGGRLTAATAVLRDPALLTVAVAAFLGAFMQMVSGAFLPLYALSIGLVLGEVGIVRMSAALTNVFARGSASPLVERFGRRRVQHFGIVLQALGLIAVSFSGTMLTLMVAMMWVASWRAIVLVANTVSLTEDVDERRVSRGVAAGIFNAAIDLGNLASPALGGVIAEQFGLPAMFRIVPLVVLALYATVNLGGLARGRWRASQMVRG